MRQPIPPSRTALIMPILKAETHPVAHPREPLHKWGAEVPECSGDSLTTTPLTEQTEEHLCSSADAEMLGASVHIDVVAPFLELKDEARGAGFELEINSGFRSFEKQLSIWNRKATGQLAVLDSDAHPLDIDLLNERELVFAILRWSAGIFIAYLFFH